MSEGEMATIETWIDGLADRVQQEQGGRARYIEWAASTRREANRLVLDAGVFDDTPVYVVQVVGGRYRPGRRRRGSSPVIASVLVIVLDRATMRARDVGHVHQPRDLASVGYVTRRTLRRTAPPESRSLGD